MSEENINLETPSVSVEQPTSETPAFQVPEAFKDKPWVEKVKSVDDVFKMYDDVQPLIGKKRIVPDPATSTPEEVAEYYQSLRPQESSAYELPDTPDKEALQKLLHESYISPWQAKILAEKHVEMSKEYAEQARSEEGYMAIMKERFGDQYEKKVSDISKTLKTLLPEDKMESLKALPNEELSYVYDIVNEVLERYGANESSVAASNAENNLASPESLEAQKNEIRDKILALSNRPHTMEEKRLLQEQYAKLIGI